MKELGICLSSGFGIRFQFEQTEAEKDASFRRISEQMKLMQQRRKLTNQELVTAVSKTDAASDDLVVEMMDRLDPTWHHRQDTEELVH